MVYSEAPIGWSKLSLAKGLDQLSLQRNRLKLGCQGDEWFPMINQCLFCSPNCKVIYITLLKHKKNTVRPTPSLPICLLYLSPLRTNAPFNYHRSSLFPCLPKHYPPLHSLVLITYTYSPHVPFLLSMLPLQIPYVLLKYGLALPKAKPDIVPNVAKNSQNNQDSTIERLAFHMSPGQISRVHTVHHSLILPGPQ